MKTNEGNKLLKEVAVRIKYLRTQKGVSSEALAYEMGINRSCMSCLEGGCNITLLTLIKVLDYYNLSIQDFFSFEMTEEKVLNKNNQ